MMNVPDAVLNAIAELDDRKDSFDAHIVNRAIMHSVDRSTLSEDEWPGYRAEFMAFQFVGYAGGDGPWASYFKPEAIFSKADGTPVYSPDVADTNEEILSYWMQRANEVNHPVLKARYADLVWDFSGKVIRKRAGIEYARMAVDSYISALQKDSGEAWGDSHNTVARVLHLSMSIGDSARIESAVEAIIDYADRTAEIDRIGTYCYLMDLLLLAKKSPPLSTEQESSILKTFEDRFAVVTMPGGEFEFEPFCARDIGIRLADYYKRRDMASERTWILTKVAKAFERRANSGDAMSGLSFREEARSYYQEAGRRDEAERMQRECEEIAPQVCEEMPRISHKYEIDGELMNRFLAELTERDLEDGLTLWAIQLVPLQEKLQEMLTGLNEKYPMQAMLGSTLIGAKGTVAVIDDTSGDPDGPAVWDTAQHSKWDSIWLSRGLDHLIQNGLDADAIADFVEKAPVFVENRRNFITRGIQAHTHGDYIQAVHILIPQIEHSLVRLIHALGGTSTKQHRSGRGVMQVKNLNDALNDPAARKSLGPDLTLYLLAMLSHPKGRNIRNEVCHGLLEPSAFTKGMSERVIHCLIAVSLLRETAEPSDAAGKKAAASVTSAT